MKHSLLSLFLPPDGYFGDFGLVSGFTASKQVLERLKRNFSGHTARPVLAAFLHPTSAAVLDIPGLAWIWPGPGPRPYNLLHAKVALLGFRSETGGYQVRLIVTTGNWTTDPLTTSIDLFWSVTLDPDDPDPQAAADLRAAWNFFDKLRARSDCGLLDQAYDGSRPDERLARAIGSLPEGSVPPRFIDSWDSGLLPQVVERMAPRTRNAQLVIGSGYFEGGANPGQTVPERLYEALLAARKVTKNIESVLVLNPDSCQGLAGAAGRLAREGWELRRPASRAHKGTGVKLHAKFALLASWNKRMDCLGSVYLGSGNMSAVGFERSVGQGGNLEAGVVLTIPKGVDWDERSAQSIYGILPVGGDPIAPDDLPTLQSGEDFERPEEPHTLPEVSHLVWRDGVLSAPGDRIVGIFGPDDAPRTTPCGWPDDPPVFVRLSGSGWTVPVVARGALVVPRPRDLTVEDILESLHGFPRPSDTANGGDRGNGEEDEDGDTGTGPPAPRNKGTYAIRRMMALLTPLAEVQKGVQPLDWPRWCRELRDNLVAVREQEEPMIAYFRAADADPLPILAHADLRPDGVDARALEDVLVEISREWRLAPDATSLWSGEIADGR